MNKQEERRLRFQLRALGSTINWTKDDFGLVFGQNGYLKETQQFANPEAPDLVFIHWRLPNFGVIRYDVTLRKNIEIPQDVIDGIDLRRLAARMEKIDWRQNYLNPFETPRLNTSPQRLAITRIIRDLKAVRAASLKGKRMADTLSFKFLDGTVNGSFIQNGALLRATYERTLSFSTDNYSATVLQAYNLLDGRYTMKFKPGPTGNNWEWMGLSPGVKNAEGNLVLKPVAGSERFDPLIACKEMGMRGYPMDVMQALENGSKFSLPLEINRIRAERIVFADPENRRIVIDKGESEKAGMYKVPDASLYRSRIAAHGSYLPMLKDRATAMGIDQTSINTLDEQVIVYGLPFTITQLKHFGNDHIKFKIYFDKDDQERFDIDRIVAVSMPDLRFSNHSISGVQLEDLAKRMRQIDWQTDFYSIKANLFHDQHPAGNPHMKAQVDQVVEDFQRLLTGKDPNGRTAAYHLAHRYLASTPNEGVITDLDENWEKNVGVRMFPGTPTFSLESLYNLMSHRFVAINHVENKEEEQQKWYQLVSNSSKNTDNGVVRVVPGQFSVREAIMTQMGLVGKELNLLARKMTQQLEAGNLVNTYIKKPSVTVSVMLFADPVAGTLQVDLQKTFTNSPRNSASQMQKLTSMPIGEFAKIVEKSRSQSMVEQNILQQLNIQKKGQEPDELPKRGKGKRR